MSDERAKRIEEIKDRVADRGLNGIDVLMSVDDYEWLLAELERAEAELRETERVVEQAHEAIDRERERAEAAEAARDNYKQLAEARSAELTQEVAQGEARIARAEAAEAALKEAREVLAGWLPILERQFASLPPAPDSNVWQFAKARLHRTRACLAQQEDHDWEPINPHALDSQRCMKCGARK